MNKYKSVVILISLMSWGAAGASDYPSGKIVMLPVCPGDKVVVKEKPAPTDEAAATALALLTPVVSSVINTGLKTVGQRLTAAAQEAQVDALHEGDYFYKWSAKESRFLNQYNCILVLSKTTEDTRKTTVERLVSGYESRLIEKSEGAPPKVKWIEDKNALASAIRKNGDFEGRIWPGLIGVFDIELSTQKTEFRLIPRFVSSGHSVREKSVDSKKRDFTFEFNFSAPGKTGNFGKSLIKVEQLTQEKPFVQTEQPEIYSVWMLVPGINPSVESAITAHKAAKKSFATLKEVVKRSAVVAELDLAGLNPDFPCESPDAIKEQRTAAYVELNQLLSSNTTTPKALNKAIHKYTYLDSCLAARNVEKEAEKEGAFESGSTARSFDLNVAIKEFRKRPVAQFVGSLLTDDTNRAGLTSGLLSALDPGTRQTAEQEAEAKQLTALAALDTAWLAAQEAEATYNACTDDVCRSNALVSWSGKQRAANRSAVTADEDLPYPEAGLWYGP